MAKYFTANIDGTEQIIGSAAATRRYLKHHPETITVLRYWWDRNDLIECEEFTRDQMLSAPAKRLGAGQTAQWAYDHQGGNRR